jgi:hypothetical protein
MTRSERIEITLPTGKSVQATKIIVQSEIPYSREKIWQLIMTTHSLQFICRPWIFFKPQKGQHLNEQWREGDTARLTLWVYGFFPFGKHNIFLERIAPLHYQIQSRETGNFITVWDHLITMKESGAGATRYSDEVVIYAGVLTGLVAWWSKGLYRHRQRRWLKLLAC